MGFLSFTVHTGGLDTLKDRLKNSIDPAEHTLALQIKKDTSPFVPFRNGVLDARTKVDGSRIVYPGPYSRYLYYGKLMVDPETGSAWAKKGNTKVLTDKNLVFSKAGHPEAQSHWFEASKAQNLRKWEETAERAIKRGLK